MNCQTWEFLVPGDYVDVLWLSGMPRPEEKREELLEKIKAVITSHGLVPRVHAEEIDPKTSLGGYYANSTEARTESLIRAFKDQTCKVIWFGRGGFGALNVLKALEDKKTKVPDRVILLCGFSDVTAFHLWAHRNKWPSLHSILANFNKETFPITGAKVNEETSVDSLLQVFTGKIREFCYRFAIVNPEVLTEGEKILDTKIVGGNFSLIQRSIGSPTALNVEDSSIFLEDTEESYNRFDSLLAGFSRTFDWEKVHCLIFGSIAMKDHPDPTWDLKKTLTHFIKENSIQIPVLYSSEFGHEAKNQVLPLGTKAQIILSGNQAQLKVDVNRSAYMQDEVSLSPLF